MEKEKTPIQKSSDRLAKTIDSDIIEEMKRKNPELFKPKYENNKSNFHK